MSAAEVLLAILMDIIRSIYTGMPPDTEAFLTTLLGNFFAVFEGFGEVLRAVWGFLAAVFGIIGEIGAVPG